MQHVARTAPHKCHEVTHAFRGFPLAQFVLHQRADGSLRLRIPESLGDESNVRDALMALFGAGQRLEIERVSEFGGKVVQYTSELAGALP